MSETTPLVPQFVFEEWLGALRTREPRALELAYALALALAVNDETTVLQESIRAIDEASSFEISSDVRELLDYAYEKYDAFKDGDFFRVDMVNANVLAFERRTNGERILIVNNLAPVSQPIKFQEYAGREGWDILNHVEFVFPPRAQLEAYEFLWLLVG